MIAAVIFVVFPLCMAFGACSDFFTMTIPNRVSAILLASFFVIAPLAGLSVAELGTQVLAAAAVFAVCFSLFAANIMGGGDAKLLTASSVWFGFNVSLVEYLIYVSFFGGVLSVLVMAMRSQENTILASGLPVPHLLFTAKKIPYGIAIGLGGFLAFPSSPLMQLAIAQAN